MKKKASRHMHKTWKLFLATCLLGNCFGLSAIAPNSADANRLPSALQANVKQQHYLSTLIRNDPIQLNRALKDLARLNFGKIKTLSPFQQLVTYKKATDIRRHPLLKRTPLAFAQSSVNKAPFRIIPQKKSSQHTQNLALESSQYEAINATARSAEAAIPDWMRVEPLKHVNKSSVDTHLACQPVEEILNEKSNPSLPCLQQSIVNSSVDSFEAGTPHWVPDDQFEIVNEYTQWLPQSNLEETIIDDGSESPPWMQYAALNSTTRPNFIGHRRSQPHPVEEIIDDGSGNPPWMQYEALRTAAEAFERDIPTWTDAEYERYEPVEEYVQEYYPRAYEDSFRNSYHAQWQPHTPRKEFLEEEVLNDVGFAKEIFDEESFKEEFLEDDSDNLPWLTNSKQASFAEDPSLRHRQIRHTPPSQPGHASAHVPRNQAKPFEVIAEAVKPAVPKGPINQKPASKIVVETKSKQTNSSEKPSRRILVTPTGTERNLSAKESFSLDQTLDRLIAQADGEPDAEAILTAAEDSDRIGEEKRTILIRFNNISIVEYIRYLSRVTNKNFIFDENELLFNVTIVSEEPTTIDDVLVALMQVLRIHGLSLIQNGDDFIIYQNPNVRGISKVEADTMPETFRGESEIVTRVFALNTLDTADASMVVKALLSESAIVQPMLKTNSLVVTDYRINVEHVNTVLRSMDSPQTGLTVGQYAVRNTDINALVQVAEQVMQPIAQGQTLMFVPQDSSDSIFIISTPFLLERVIPILQRLDQNSGTTGVYDLRDVEFRAFNDWKKALYGGVQTGKGRKTEKGEALGPGHSLYMSSEDGVLQKDEVQGSQWKIDPNGAWYYNMPDSQNLRGSKPPLGTWSTDHSGNWIFEESPEGTPGGVPTDLINQFNGLRTGLTRVEEFQKANEEGRVIDLDRDPLPAPRGRWTKDENGNWRFQLDPGESITSSQLTRFARLNPQLPVGFVEQTKFYIHKLQFRKGDLVEAAIRKIADSLSQSAEANSALLATLNSVQWLEESNSIVIAGPPAQIEKVREVILEIDVPLRQVFIEMLILDTTVDDSLNYGVNWGSKFGGGDTAGAQGFVVGGTPFTGTLGIGSVNSSVSTTGSLIPPTPNAAPLAGFEQGFTLGIIGRHIVNKCLGEFNSIGALVEALHSLTTNNIILNPKIVTEDNVPAELFVGINTRFLTQSISNDQGSIVTTNFEFRDVGTRLKVTPMLGPSNIITLEIEEEVSSVAPNSSTGSSGGLANIDPGPTTRKSNTKTRVHLPDGFFLILSGNIQDDLRVTRYNVPCLGGLPYIGAAFSNVRNTDAKRNLMIFIRPKLIDTEEEMTNITRHQQDVWKLKNRITPMWKHEVEGALEWGNIKKRAGCGPKCDWEYINDPPIR